MRTMQCDQCGAPFEASSRPSRRFCGGACRTRAGRARRVAAGVPPGPSTPPGRRGHGPAGRGRDGGGEGADAARRGGYGGRPRRGGAGPQSRLAGDAAVGEGGVGAGAAGDAGGGDGGWSAVVVADGSGAGRAGSEAGGPGGQLRSRGGRPVRITQSGFAHFARRRAAVGPGGVARGTGAHGASQGRRRAPHSAARSRKLFLRRTVLSRCSHGSLEPAGPATGPCGGPMTPTESRRPPAQASVSDTPPPSTTRTGWTPPPSTARTDWGADTRRTDGGGTLKADSGAYS